jgi:hypothetical protein
MQIHSVGIDLGKTTFHLVALSAAGKVLLRKKFTQNRSPEWCQPRHKPDLCRGTRSPGRDRHGPDRSALR